MSSSGPRKHSLSPEESEGQTSKKPALESDTYAQTAKIVHDFRLHNKKSERLTINASKEQVNEHIANLLFSIHIARIELLQTVNDSTVASDLLFKVMKVARLQLTFGNFCKPKERPNQAEAKERAWHILKTEHNISEEHFEAVDSKFKDLELRQFGDTKEHHLIEDSKSESGFQALSAALENTLSQIREMKKDRGVAAIIENPPNVTKDASSYVYWVL